MGLFAWAQEEEADLLFTDEYARVLHSSPSPFERSAQFDWSLGWFRYRGLGPEHTAYYLNGAKINSTIDRRIDWNRWGGLNDITRYPETTMVASPSLLPPQVAGAQYVRTDTENQRAPFRLTVSSADRSYASRVMATALNDLGRLKLLTSGSIRSAHSGFYDDTPYKSRSGFIQLSLDRPGVALKALAMSTSTSRVSPEAHTKEVWALAGSRFNSGWGYDEHGRIPLKPRLHKHQFYQFELSKSFKELKWTAGAFGYVQQFERQNLGYQLAANPFATYYRYLPSFYGSRPFLQSRMIQHHALNNGIDLDRLKQANANSAFARYQRISDVRHSKQGAVYSNLSREKLNSRFGLWAQHTYESAAYFQRLDALLGAKYYLNRDLYSDLSYDITTDPIKFEGDKVNYHYRLSAHSLEAAIFKEHSFRQLEIKAQLYARNSWAQRHGLAVHQWHEFEPERSTVAPTLDYSLFFSATFFRSAQSEWRLRGFTDRSHQAPEGYYLNPRYSHFSDMPDADRFFEAAVHYFYKIPELAIMLQTTYLSHYDAISTTHFFAEAEAWQDLITQRVRGTRGSALEFSGGLQYELSTEISLEGAFYLLYNRLRAPESVRLHLPRDTGESAVSRIHEVDLPVGAIYHSASGPQRAMSLGLTYRSLNYWNLSLKSNYLSHAYIPVSWPQQSSAFKQELAAYGLQPPVQERLQPLFYLQFLLSKSWRTSDGYLQLFVSLSNLTNTVSPIAGYASSRLLNPRDYAADQVYQPVFATKYWQNIGRNYFINLSYSFNSF